MAYLTTHRGDDETLEIVVTDPDAADVPVDLTATTMTFLVKEKRGDLDVDALITKTVGSGITVTNAVGGLAEVAIADTDTNSLAPDVYWWELQAVKSSRVSTLASGRFALLLDIVRTI